MNISVVGICSICGGMVTVPSPWMGIIPPTPTCRTCGAVAAQQGPVIPMRERKWNQNVYITSTYKVPKEEE